jgi:hypothetical protein
MNRLAGCVVALVLSVPAVGLAQVRPPDARESFGFLKALVCYDAERPKNKADWAARIQKGYGLKPMTGSSLDEISPMFTLETPTGEVRANAFFRDNETVYHLLFFPRTSTAPPAAVTTWLLSQPSPVLDDADSLEITLPTQFWCGSATHADKVLMSLSSGRFIRVSFDATWKSK